MNQELDLDLKKEKLRKRRATEREGVELFASSFSSLGLLLLLTSPARPSRQQQQQQQQQQNLHSQLLDPSAGTALGAAAANLAGGGLREASNLLQETGLGASFAEAGGAAAKAAVGALAAGTNADIRTLPNANGKPGGGGAAASSRQQTERHKELDRASEAIGSGRQQVLGGGGGGGASIFSMMGTAPGAELTSAASAPKDYVPKPYREEDRGTRDAAASGAAASAASAASSDGERSIGPFPVPNQPGTGGAGFDPRSGGGGGGGGDASFAPGAKSFPGSGDAPRSSLYATNDAGTGPAPVSGGGFQPLESGGGFADGGKVMSGGGGVGGGGGGGGGGGKSATPLRGGGGGGSAPASAGGSSVAPAPLVGGAVVGQDGRASLPVNSFAQQQPQQPQQTQQQQPPQPPQPQSSNGGVGSDGLVHAPGGAASAPLGVVDTQPTTTAVTGTAPGGLPFKMTIGRRRRRRRRSRMAMA